MKNKSRIMYDRRPLETHAQYAVPNRACNNSAFHFIALTLCLQPCNGFRAEVYIIELELEVVGAACMLAPYGGARSSEGGAPGAPPWIRH